MNWVNRSRKESKPDEALPLRMIRVEAPEAESTFVGGSRLCRMELACTYQNALNRLVFPHISSDYVRFRRGSFDTCRELYPGRSPLMKKTFMLAKD